MSLKPKKKSDEKKLKAKMKVKESKMDSLSVLPPYTMIVSEGIKTEPFYIQGIVDKINAKYSHISKKPHIEVFGTGRNTQGLIRYIDKKIADGSWDYFRKFWLMYDKDDFPLDNFDNTQFEAEARKNPKISVAWSNESIELWFLLHFEDYHADNGRLFIAIS
ncbi:MAG: RloB family protein [Lachnospiraceae bacterium]|nr:RloB family protein [Lachnospiraceae bacterium]